ncbi:putative transposase [Escherichia coli]|uniref:Putative transposase n=1 Tax=Escherichia coli TaxID=562 RepID=A0A376KNN6_ECOLX|nr:putative transposase [Escherichia coli]
MAKEVPEALERLKERLPLYLINMLDEQYQRITELDEHLDHIEKQLQAVARQNETCQRLLNIPGVGPLIATAAVATMGDASAFKSGRNSPRLSVWCPDRQAQEEKSACWE